MIFKIASAYGMNVLDSSGNADTADWNFEKRPGMLYFVARAVTADVPNGNGDYFEADELKRAFKTFVGKGLFLNHASTDVEKQRGKIIDAQWIEKSNGKYVNCLVEVNAEAYPELALMIKSSHITDVSMGCQVAFSTCSICNHRAPTIKEYCQHIKMSKGGVHGIKPVYEVNHGVEFIELSIVTRGADSEAKILEVFARQNGLNYEELLEKHANGELNIDGLMVSDSATSIAQALFLGICRANARGNK